MNVRPTNHRPVPQPDAGSLRRSTPKEGAAPEGAAALPESVLRDRVAISNEALDLQRSRESAREAELPAERMQAILGRITQGFYDRVDVRDRILERMASDLENSDSGA